MKFRSLATLRVAFGLAAVTALHAFTLAAQQPQQPMPPAPTGATARCRDGTYSFSRHRSGTCSHNGGVAAWLRSDSVRTPTPPTVDTLSPMARGEVAVCGGACGVERWAVKTLSDPNRTRVQPEPVNTTIEALVALQ